MNKVPMERLRELLRLDVDTGLLHWLVDRQNGAKHGDIAGSQDRNRYIRLEIDQVRLATVKPQSEFMENLETFRHGLQIPIDDHLAAV